MTGQLALWEPEPCHHGEAPAPDRDWTDDELAEWLHSRRRPAIPPDAGRPAGRPTWSGIKTVTDIDTRGDLL